MSNLGLETERICPQSGGRGSQPFATSGVLMNNGGLQYQGYQY